MGARVARGESACASGWASGEGGAGSVPGHRCGFGCCQGPLGPTRGSPPVSRPPNRRAPIPSMRPARPPAPPGAAAGASLHRPVGGVRFERGPSPRGPSHLVGRRPRVERAARLQPLRRQGLARAHAVVIQRHSGSSRDDGRIGGALRARVLARRGAVVEREERAGAVAARRAVVAPVNLSRGRSPRERPLEPFEHADTWVEGVPWAPCRLLLWAAPTMLMYILSPHQACHNAHRRCSPGSQQRSPQRVHSQGPARLCVMLKGYMRLSINEDDQRSEPEGLNHTPVTHGFDRTRFLAFVHAVCHGCDSAHKGALKLKKPLSICPWYTPGEEPARRRPSILANGRRQPPRPPPPSGLR